MCKHKWEIIKTIWPFEYGWGVRCKKCNMVTDTGLPKEQAELIAATMNRGDTALTTLEMGEDI